MALARGARKVSTFNWVKRFNWLMNCYCIKIPQMQLHRYTSQLNTQLPTYCLLIYDDRKSITGFTSL